jgi:C-terminal processing protease CtpA/Prc
MRSSRLTLSLCLAAALSACGGSSAAPTAGTPTPTQTGTGTPAPTQTGTGTPTACSLSKQEDWAYSQLNEWYLFPSLIDTSVNANRAPYSDLQSFVDALLAPARAQSKDRHFTYVTSISEENALINSGQTAGFGFRLSYYNDNGTLRVYVNESFEGTAALGANIDRGDEILGIGPVGGPMLMVNTLPATNAAVQQVIDALGPSTAGTKRVLSVQHYGGAQQDVTLTKTTYNLDPVSSRYGQKVINYGGTLYGYVNLRTFISTTADQELRDAFLSFKNQGIDKVIVDLRYNGGGLLSVSQLLGSLMASNHANDPFAYMSFRQSKSAGNDQTLDFQTEANAISAMKIAFIGGAGTASASELAMNAFPPYIGKNVALVGENTYGKPVGQIAQDLTDCDTRFRIIAFKLENADHYGGYYTGLATDPTNDPNSFLQKATTCKATDDIFHQLGDPNEAEIATALSWLDGGSCTAIASAGTKTIQAAKARRVLLQPAQPSAAQYRIPGLF